MASSGKTSNYQLNQWTSNDYVRMADFNADNQKIDTALKALDSRAKIVYGSYVGTGTCDANTPMALDFANTLGEAPKLFYISNDDYANPMLAVRGVHRIWLSPLRNSNPVILEWTATGLRWHADDAATQFNSTNITYYYVAIA